MTRKSFKQWVWTNPLGRSKLAVLTLLMTALVAGCSGPSNEEITLTTRDQVTLAGTLFESQDPGDIALVLAHMGNDYDQTSWHGFAQFIADRGFTALAFDFRSHGLSEIPTESLQIERFTEDVLAAGQFLRDRGYARVVCMGASLGGDACMESAYLGDLDWTALAIIASGYGHLDSPEQFASLTLPKLFVTADQDPYATQTAMPTMYDWSAEPKQLEIIPGTAHGTDLFNSESADLFREILVSFLEGL